MRSKHIDRWREELSAERAQVALDLVVATDRKRECEMMLEEIVRGLCALEKLEAENE